MNSGVLEGLQDGTENPEGGRWWELNERGSEKIVSWEEERRVSGMEGNPLHCDIHRKTHIEMKLDYLMRTAKINHACGLILKDKSIFLNPNLKFSSRSCCWSSYPCEA